MVSIFICGDFVNRYSYTNFFGAKLSNEIKKANLSICNFEAPIDSIGLPIPKQGKVLSQLPESMAILKEQGFNLLLLANNHISDFGSVGIKATIDEAKEKGLLTIGASLFQEELYKPLIMDVCGIRFGIINASEKQFGAEMVFNDYNAGYTLLNHPYMDDLIKCTKKKVDYLILLPHAGLENYEIPIAEWRDRYKQLCDLGADCVVASHPHSSQGYEMYDNKYIFYSLGNFYFPFQEKLKKNEYGFSVVLHFNKEAIQKPSIVYHRRTGLFLDMIPEEESPLSTKYLNSMLCNGDYQKQVNCIYLHAFERIWKNMICSTFDLPYEKDGHARKIKKVVKQIITRNLSTKKRDLLLLHLIRNETYRYVIQRALEIKTGA